MKRNIHYLFIFSLIGSFFMILPQASAAGRPPRPCPPRPLLPRPCEVTECFQSRFDEVLATKSTDDLAEGEANFYWTSARFNEALAAKSTDDLAEGASNLYWSDARFSNAFAAQSTDSLAEGASNLYWSDTRFNEALAGKTTDDFIEGSNNHYSQWAESGTDIYFNSGYVGIGTTSPGEQLEVSGSIKIPVAGTEDNNSPAIIAQSNDDFLYDGEFINHYAFGFHYYDDRGTGENKINAYVAAYFGFDIFTSGESRVRVNNNGNVGIGTNNPQYPLEMKSGAYVTEGGVWTDASSIQYKTDISSLPLSRALEVLADLNPVTFRYKASWNERHVGFIAEEVPELVATQDRRGLSPMDVVAVLTKVVQNQQREIEELKAQLEKMR